MIVCAPMTARALAVSYPIPVLAPVTTATLPERSTVSLVPRPSATTPRDETSFRYDLAYRLSMNLITVEVWVSL